MIRVATSNVCRKHSPASGKLTGTDCAASAAASADGSARKRLAGDGRDQRKVEIIAIWPGFGDRLYGVAIDVGSTTIAAHLCDLASGEVIGSAGWMNPQIRFGEDLMSRVSYIMMNPGGETELIEHCSRCDQRAAC